MNIFVKRLKALARTLPGDVSLERSLRIIIVLAFGGVVVYYAIGRQQSFTLHVTTNSAKMQVQDDRLQYWDLSGATLCLRKTTEPPSEESKSLPKSPLCNPARYVNGQAGGDLSDNDSYSEVTWANGTILDMDVDLDHTLVVSVRYAEPEKRNFALFDDVPITPNSVLYIPRASLRSTEALSLTGEINLGRNPKGRESSLLLKGSYEIREALRLTSGPTLVSKGEFLPGDFVTLQTRRGATLPATLLMMPPAKATDAGVEIVATSPLRRSAIVVDRIGAKRTQITTRWMDRLANDALPLALSIFLGLLGASLGIAKSLVAPVPAKSKEKTEPEDQNPA